MRRAKRPAAVRVALVIALGLGVAALGWPLGPGLATLMGWDAAAIAYICWCWWDIASMSSDQTARHAIQKDPSRATASALLLGASVASLLAVAVVVARASHSSGLAKGGQICLVMMSVVLSWAVVHTVFTLRYAHLYYLDPPGGVDFNQGDNPAYTDFAYLSFTIGMTFQVSDTDLTTPQLRATALRHALLSYLFGTVIGALTINLVAGLVR
jgi:uncharacterized membrane protein